MSHDPITVTVYHERSKHHLDRYANGPENLDWGNQPDPFRRFFGSTRIPLPLSASPGDTPYQALFQPGGTLSKPLDRVHVGLFLELSMGLSAWKQYGPDRWSLRINPSSGNLHPTECYLMLPSMDTVDAGVYHYHSYAHELEQRCKFTANEALPADSFLVGLSSIHRRESWKYGERAWRYCQHDVGHALGTLRMACALLGWHCQLLDACSDTQIAALLGLSRETDFEHAEHEAPDLLLQIHTTGETTLRVSVNDLLMSMAEASWTGQANHLSKDNLYSWPIIDQIDTACRKPVTAESSWILPLQADLPTCIEQISAESVIRGRRSAQAFDGTAPPLPQYAFVRMLHCLLPQQHTPPLDCLPWSPRLHLVLFVHCVTGLAPGLYALPRSKDGETLMREQLRDEFVWTPVDAQAHLHLYLLIAANSGNAARTLACHQPIASDSAFSLAMLADFGNAIDDTPWRYRQLFWETGLIGQSLYLEAEAAGVRGTGIGCYFDDAVHETLGLKSRRLQDLYHFTVGTPRLDNRLESLPPYGHLDSTRRQ